MNYIYPKATCVPCLRRLVEQTAGLATGNEDLKAEAGREANRIIDDCFPALASPAEVATVFHRAIKKITGNRDPFSAWKTREIDQARSLFSLVEKAYRKDSLLSVLKLAVLGNSLDFFCPEKEIRRAISKVYVEFELDDSGILEKKLAGADKILLLADNAGEVFFDLPLYRYLDGPGKEVSYVVKAEAVQNDMTEADLQKSGLRDKYKRVLTNESDVVGFHPETAGADFREIYKQAHLIIAKGMGHLEVLGQKEDERLFYLLKAKCRPVADRLGVPLGSYVIGYSPDLPAVNLVK
ncbi:MAG: DUF89 domain-containing protein [bacterium]